jgi:hypothetical protein
MKLTKMWFTACGEMPREIEVDKDRIRNIHDSDYQAIYVPSLNGYWPFERFLFPCVYRTEERAWDRLLKNQHDLVHQAEVELKKQMEVLSFLCAEKLGIDNKK